MGRARRVTVRELRGIIREAAKDYSTMSYNYKMWAKDKGVSYHDPSALVAYATGLGLADDEVEELAVRSGVPSEEALELMPEARVRQVVREEVSRSRRRPLREGITAAALQNALMKAPKANPPSGAIGVTLADMADFLGVTEEEVMQAVIRRGRDAEVALADDTGSTGGRVEDTVYVILLQPEMDRYVRRYGDNPELGRRGRFGRSYGRYGRRFG